jgi:protein O-mannosyl-transferase
VSQPGHQGGQEREAAWAAWPAVATCLAITAVGVACYAGALRGELVFDDLRQIQGNPLLRDLGNYLGSDAGYLALPNRYVGYLTFALNIRFAGLSVEAFRLVNLLIHIANALLVCALVRLAFRAPRLRQSTLAGDAWAVAATAGALFVAHPLQTEAVTYVVQRFASLSTFFYLGATVLWLRLRLADAPRRRDAWRRALDLAPVLAFALLAMRTKEIAFTLPFAILLVELVLFGRPDRSTLVLLAPVLATAAVIPVTLLLSPSPPNLGDAAASGAGRLSPLEYLATQLTVIPRYLRLFLLPLGQNFDPDLPGARSFLEPQVLAGLTLIVALLAGAAWCLRAPARRAADPALRLVGLGGLWFFLGLSVESTLVPLADVMAEHRAYLPSAGLVVTVAAGGALLARSLAPRRLPMLLLSAAAVVTLSLSAATVARNRVWRDELSLWADTAAKSPSKARVQLNLGMALYERGRVDEAIGCFLRAVGLRPDYAEAHTDLGVAYGRKGLTDEASREIALGLQLSAGRPLP